MHVILVGFMGAGKTTLGKALAAKLGIPFIDTDQLIENSSVSTIKEIFSTKGEAYFRELEKEVVEKIEGYNQPHVIATGGGLPCFNGLMERLNALGSTVYLKHSPEVLLERLRGDGSERPLFNTSTGDNVLAEITKRLKDREKVYLRAHVVLETAEQDPETIIARLPLRKN